MINRYGPWMDSNTVLPTGPRSCLVRFDYFLEASCPHVDDEQYIEAALKSSDLVQQEDEYLCHSVHSVWQVWSRFSLLLVRVPAGRRTTPNN